MNLAPFSTGRRPARGFALIVTIVLVAFLVLILVGLATFTRVETQVASNSQNLAQARQNALFALNLAVGQLQRHTGPDQRVTATADLQPLATMPNPFPYPVTDPASGANLSGAAATTLTSIDDFWSDRRNRRWTGAWANGNASSYDRSAPADFNTVPRLQSWLVSGNENSPAGDTFRPTDRLPALSTASTPREVVNDAAGRPHRILVKAAAGVDAPADFARIVTAPQVPVTADNVPGFGDPQVIGHYAWWVGDEGVKVRATLEDPYFNVATAEARLNRFQLAQRPAVEVMNTAFSALDPGSHTANLAGFRADLRKVVTTPQLAYLDAAPAFSEALKDRFHEITVWSRGVLADAKSGGLKADLTYLLSQPEVDDFRTALRHAYHGNNAVAPSGSHNPGINTVSTPYAELPANVPDATAYNGGDGILSASTTWEQLWSFYNFSATNSNGVFNGSGQAESRRPTPTQHALHPLVVQAKLFYRLRIVGGTDDPDGVNRSGIIHVDTVPLAVLANPYPVDLAPHDYQLVISGAAPQLRFGETDAPANIDTDFVRAFPEGEPTYNGRVRLVLRSGGIPAGEARVFTIDPDAADNPDIDPVTQKIPVTSSTDERLVVMNPEYNPTPALTYNTGQSIPAAPKTRAALRSRPGQLNTLLYMDNGGPSASDHQRLIQYVRFQDYSIDLPTGTGSFFIVDPIATGERRGGGYIMVVTQPPTTDNPATPGTSRLFSHHQAPFYQFNYRGLVATNVGNTTGGLQGVVETGRTFSKNGSAGAASEFLAANLLFSGGPDSGVRWGLVNIGEGNDQTTVPASINGAGDVGFTNYLYDVPRRNRPIRSLGQLQHLSPSGFIPPGVSNFESGSNVRGPIVVNNWQVNYPVSNSYPHPRVRREQVFGALPEHSYHYDGSFLWNHVLWDRFHFSTYPQSGAFTFTPGNNLPNARYRPFRDTRVVPWDDEASFRGDGNAATAINGRLPAKNLLLDGAFNINSTSVEAWKALFSSLRDVQVGSHSGTTGPFSRTLTPAGGTDSAPQRGRTPESWNGFRDLSTAEIESLAQEMVLQVRRRGPFLSLADFLNRRLVAGRNSTATPSPHPDPLSLGLSGALQAALDRSVNLTAHIHSNFRVQTKAFVREVGAQNNVNHNAMRDFDYRMPHALVGHPSHVLQGDVLSSLGAALSARSDTFVIRTYGDAYNAASGEVTGQAWCEAVVQRLPDYVDPSTDATALPVAGSDNEKFGRRYQIVSFRWLGPEDI